MADGSTYRHRGYGDFGLAQPSGGVMAKDKAMPQAKCQTCGELFTILYVNEDNKLCPDCYNGEEAAREKEIEGER
jgi:hypothetical protein